MTQILLILSNTRFRLSYKIDHMIFIVNTSKSLHNNPVNTESYSFQITKQFLQNIQTRYSRNNTIQYNGQHHQLTKGEINYGNSI